MICMLLFLPSILQSANQLLIRPLSITYLNTVYFFLNFLAVLGIFPSFLRRSFLYMGKNAWFLLGTVVLAFAGYFLVSAGLEQCLQQIAPGFSNVNDKNIAAQATDNYPVMFLCTVLLVPIAEETFYRGILFGVVSKKSRLAGYLLSCAVFSAIHVIGYLGAASKTILLLCFVQYLPAGFFLAWSYQKAKTIFAPIAIHTGINLLGILAVRF